MTDLITEIRQILMNDSVSHEARVYAARVLIDREAKPRKNMPNPGYSQADPAWLSHDGQHPDCNETAPFSESEKPVYAVKTNPNPGQKRWGRFP